MNIYFLGVIDSVYIVQYSANIAYIPLAGVSICWGLGPYFFKYFICITVSFTVKIHICLLFIW